MVGLSHQLNPLYPARYLPKSSRLSVRIVREINRMVEVPRVPEALWFEEAVINLYGRIIRVLGLRRRSGISAQIGKTTPELWWGLSIRGWRP